MLREISTLGNDIAVQSIKSNVHLKMTKNQLLGLIIGATLGAVATATILMALGVSDTPRVIVTGVFAGMGASDRTRHGEERRMRIRSLKFKIMRRSVSQHAADHQAQHRIQISIMQLSRLIALAAFFFLMSQPSVSAAEPPGEQPDMMIIGSMHQVIGRGESQGRVRLSELAARRHFYGVGAVEGLAGEITILDSQPTVTTVTHDGRLRESASDDTEATLLIGQSVRNWSSLTIQDDTRAEDFDQLMRALAEQKGISPSKPFLFVVEGEFQDVKLHVINGACPVHARARGIEIEEERQPYERVSTRIRGTLVGIHALDSAGRLTTPEPRHIVI